MGLALGIMALFSQSSTVNFGAAFASAPHLAEETLLFCNLEVHALTLISLLLFVGAVGKSAQLGAAHLVAGCDGGANTGLRVIHAATMVTAGVFMIALPPLFEYAPAALLLVALLGGMTCFFAATTGLVQTDIRG